MATRRSTRCTFSRSAGYAAPPSGLLPTDSALSVEPSRIVIPATAGILGHKSRRLPGTPASAGVTEVLFVWMRLSEPDGEVCGGQPILHRLRRDRVGWVERSEAHRILL